MSTTQDALHNARFVHFYHGFRYAVWHGGLTVQLYEISFGEHVASGYWSYEVRPTIDKVIEDCLKRGR